MCKTPDGIQVKHETPIPRWKCGKMISVRRKRLMFVAWVRVGSIDALTYISQAQRLFTLEQNDVACRNARQSVHQARNVYNAGEGEWIRDAGRCTNRERNARRGNTNGAEYDMGRPEDSSGVMDDNTKVGDVKQYVAQAPKSHADRKLKRKKCTRPKNMI